METKLLAVNNEAVFIPVEMDMNKAGRLFEALSGTHGLKSFAQGPDGSFLLAGPEEKNNLTRYRIMKDRVILTYDFCRNSLQHFDAKISDFYEKFTQLTGIQLFLTNLIALRKTAKIDSYPDGRDYLIKKVFSLKEENLFPFKRPLHVIGTRIFFPAMPNDPCSFEIKIENTVEDHNTLYIENLAMFARAFEPRKDPTIISKDIQRADKFIEENIRQFLVQFSGEAQ